MKLCVTLFWLLAALGGRGLADEQIRQGRSVAGCSSETLVCAVAKDGRSYETDECRAQHDRDTIRFLPGACWDAD